MLELFEEYTYDLTDYEREKLLPLFIQAFQKKVGVQNAVTNSSIVKKLKGQYIISDARVRKIINFIRTRNIVPGLMASSKGYYISKDSNEIQKYIRSLQGREQAIRQVTKAMQEYLLTINNNHGNNNDTN